MSHSLVKPPSPTHPSSPRWTLSALRQYRGAIADVILGALVLGPIAAPLVTALAPFPLSLIATLIYFMGDQVCPQPDMAVRVISSDQMAVCMRCYGVLLALVITRLLYIKDHGTGKYWLRQYGILGAAIATLLTFAYPIEMLAQLWNWWGYQNGIVTAFGALTGLGIGLFIVPILYNSKDRCRRSQEETT
jgi:uncharacterized membrane protein